MCNRVEKNKKKELNKLMSDWKKQIRTKTAIPFADDGELYPTEDYFYTDGFYPGYFASDNKRVLFIGREARYSSTYYSNGDRVSTDLEWFKKVNVNKSSYWRRILYIMKGIQTKGTLLFANLPSANDILSEMKNTGNYGFAIMNISKYSNDSEYGASADFKLINRFLKDFELDKRNFIREEIELLDPDIIITANLWDGNIDVNQLEKIIPDNQCKLRELKKGIATLWDYKLNGKDIKLIDTWHFSK